MHWQIIRCADMCAGSQRAFHEGVEGDSGAAETLCRAPVILSRVVLKELAASGRLCSIAALYLLPWVSLW